MVSEKNNERVANSGRKPLGKPDTIINPDLVYLMQLVEEVQVNFNLTGNSTALISGLAQPNIAMIGYCKNEPTRRNLKKFLNLVYLATGKAVSRDDVYREIDPWEKENSYIWELPNVNIDGVIYSLAGVAKVNFILGTNILRNQRTIKGFYKENTKLFEKTKLDVERLTELCSIDPPTIPSDRELSWVLSADTFFDYSADSKTPLDVGDLKLLMCPPELQKGNTPEQQKASPAKARKAELIG